MIVRTVKFCQDIGSLFHCFTHREDYVQPISPSPDYWSPFFPARPVPLLEIAVSTLSRSLLGCAKIQSFPSPLQLPVDPQVFFQAYTPSHHLFSPHFHLTLLVLYSPHSTMATCRLGFLILSLHAFSIFSTTLFYGVPACPYASREARVGQVTVLCLV